MWEYREALLPYLTLPYLAHCPTSKLEVWSKLSKCAVVGWNVERQMNRLDTAKVIFGKFVYHFLSLRRGELGGVGFSLPSLVD